MHKTSRKKIRGYIRKKKTLSNWMQYIVAYPFVELKVNAQPITFRLNLPPFYWFSEDNPPERFTNEIFQAFFEIEKSLDKNIHLKEKNLSFQIWLFYPRTIKSVIIVGTKERLDQFRKDTGQKDTNEIPPKIIGSVFQNRNWKIFLDKTFSSNDPNRNGPNWITHVHGKIWVIEK
ncbi:MAG: hypothetical protein V4667_05260 [Bacteroidota bacterium]